MGQIGNLKKIVSGFSTREERISKSINRDMWSALKYALRVAYLLEAKNLLGDGKKESAWTGEIRKAEKDGYKAIMGAGNTGARPGFARTIGRAGGNRN